MRKPLRRDVCRRWIFAGVVVWMKASRKMRNCQRNNLFSAIIYISTVLNDEAVPLRWHSFIKWRNQVFWRLPNGNIRKVEWTDKSMESESFFRNMEFYIVDFCSYFILLSNSCNSICFLGVYTMMNFACNNEVLDVWLLQGVLLRVHHQAIVYGGTLLTFIYDGLSNRRGCQGLKLFFSSDQLR